MLLVTFQLKKWKRVTVWNSEKCRFYLWLLFQASKLWGTYYKRVDGFCSSEGCSEIRTESECNNAADFLGLPQISKTHNDPLHLRMPGCIYYTPTASTEFNYEFESVSEWADMDSICKCYIGTSNCFDFHDLRKKIISFVHTLKFSLFYTVLCCRTRV